MASNSMVSLCTVFTCIACKEASLFGVDSCPCTPASTFYKLRDIARRDYVMIVTENQPRLRAAIEMENSMTLLAAPPSCTRLHPRAHASREPARGRAV